MEHVTSCDSGLVLKTQPGNTRNIVMTLGGSAVADNLGKFYYYDSTSTATEDLVNYNVITPNNNVGRWLAVFQRVMQLPHGTLMIDGNIRRFISQTTTTSGLATINLTTDNTTNGPAIFTSVMHDNSISTVDTTVPSDVVISGRKSLSVNLKQLTHVFTRGNTTLLNLSVVTTGLTISSHRLAADGTPVSFLVYGK